jgi:hypothetical protein
MKRQCSLAERMLVGGVGVGGGGEFGEKDEEWCSSLECEALVEDDEEE